MRRIFKGHTVDLSTCTCRYVARILGMYRREPCLYTYSIQYPFFVHPLRLFSQHQRLFQQTL